VLIITRGPFQQLEYIVRQQRAGIVGRLYRPEFACRHIRVVCLAKDDTDTGVPPERHPDAAAGAQRPVICAWRRQIIEAGVERGGYGDLDVFFLLFVTGSGVAHAGSTIADFLALEFVWSG